MELTELESENSGSAVPRLEAKGTTSADTISEQKNIKVCPHRFNGCISQNGYVCLHDGPCEPVDHQGRKFRVIMVRTADGHEIWGRDFERLAASIIDADAEIAKTPFADAKPFNPAQFCEDVIGS